MTNDSKLFPPREQWEAMGYKPDPFGRWVRPEGEVSLPLYQGGMIHHFDPRISWIRKDGGNGRRIGFPGQQADEVRSHSIHPVSWRQKMSHIQSLYSGAY